MDSTIFYGVIFALSLVCALVYIYMWHKHFDVNFTMIFALIPIATVGYVFSSTATDLDGAIISKQIIYVGGVFLQYFILMSILSLCHVNVPKLLRTLVFAVDASLYTTILTIGRSGIFYKSVSMEMVDGVPVLVREYGFMHNIFYILVMLHFLAGIIVIGHAWFRKKDVPRKILLLLVIPDVICILSFFVGTKAFSSRIDYVPLGYLIAEVVYLFIISRVNLYDISNTVIDSYVQEERVGYLSFDFRLRYLGCNAIAQELIPELKDMVVDGKLGESQGQRKIGHFIEAFRKSPENHTFVHTVHGTDGQEYFYNVNVNYLYDGKMKRGYILTLVDDTSNKKFIQLLDTYNEELQNEVAQKTKHIVEMHDNLIMSLAMMVESRDNSTGGHIMRTSEGVRILMDEIVKEQGIAISEEFCRNVIKAAPMHDLGKIAVDDEVLRKPGRFTEKEYAKMKLHAPEGARIIHKILLHTDDEHFKIIAENVAHYHHERFDGSGYPDGLKGEEIPLEARIMAIADVYDALVSKRVYKDAFDFEKANGIIMEGMGTQFDPQLQAAYERARPRLEEYYSTVE